LALEGESYRVILAVSWVLAQAQNGFLDVMLEMGAAGLTIVLLVFGFAFRDGVVCLLRSRDHDAASGGGMVSRHRHAHTHL
jgi:exopolysaccharide production protein ExoQ